MAAGSVATLTGKPLDGALYETIYLYKAGTVSINNSNTISNASATYLLTGMYLPGTVTPVIAGTVTDANALRLTGSFTAAATTLGPDPLGTGTSVWHVVGSISVSNAATLQIDPNTIIKFAATTALDVTSGGTLNILGQVGSEVIFTSVNDNTVGGTVPGSTGTPAAADWLEVKFNQGSSGSVLGTKILYGGSWSRWAALYIHNASPTIRDVTISDTTGYGLYLNSTSSTYPVSPQISNLTIQNTLRESMYLRASGTGITAPVFSGVNSIANAPSNYAAIYMTSAGVNPMLSGFTVTGGKYSLQMAAGAGATLTGNTLDGALNEAIYLSNAGTVSINNSKTISNAPAPYLLTGMSLPGTVTPLIAGTVTDANALLLTGSFNAAATTLGQDPLGTGTSVWPCVGAIACSNAATL